MVEQAGIGHEAIDATTEYVCWLYCTGGKEKGVAQLWHWHWPLILQCIDTGENENCAMQLGQLRELGDELGEEVSWGGGGGGGGTSHLETSLDWRRGVEKRRAHNRREQ